MEDSEAIGAGWITAETGFVLETKTLLIFQKIPVGVPTAVIHNGEGASSTHMGEKED